MGLLNFLRDATSDFVVSPVKGEIRPLSNCSDSVFAQGMMGEGAVFLPSEGKIFSPVTGSIEVVFKTLHAIGIKSDADREIMVHVGIDTVELDGAPFVAHVDVGDKVTAGDLILEVDLSALEMSGKSSETVVTVSDLGDKHLEIISAGMVDVGDKVMRIR
ncbi:PTS sugar transporter subunit IIA [Thermophilibacter immobilis]|uniref:PTS glucose transporter subunit IIA n=1 Tax=Thermophilibacter immobilis TaxID=2779519 RepID=A0A7S7RUJ9_9ACTN|nr:PTS glucose transporter subunit IIA [Thermophilibacter immobilis]QOY61351.1 PTS glucose transporter subunit IIA [Thermophilibacter immobilis]